MVDKRPEEDGIQFEDKPCEHKQAEWDAAISKGLDPYVSVGTFCEACIVAAARRVGETMSLELEKRIFDSILADAEPVPVKAGGVFVGYAYASDAEAEPSEFEWLTERAGLLCCPDDQDLRTVAQILRWVDAGLPRWDDRPHAHHLLLHYLDTEDLVEHGVSLRGGAWLSSEGREWLQRYDAWRAKEGSR